jgi:hypothetical protein
MAHETTAQPTMTGTTCGALVQAVAAVAAVATSEVVATATP